MTTKDAADEIAALRELVAALEGLLVQYRMQSRPPDKVLDRLAAARKAAAFTSERVSP